MITGSHDHGLKGLGLEETVVVLTGYNRKSPGDRETGSESLASEE